MIPPSKIARFNLEQTSARKKIDDILKNMHDRLKQVEAENEALKARVDFNRNLICATYFARGMGNEVPFSELMEVG